MNYIRTIKSPAGRLTLASDGKSLTGLWIEGQKYFGGRLESSREKNPLPVLDRVEKWLGQYFAGKKPRLDFPLDPAGSDFRRKVWQQLLDIPYGEVTTYGEIARKLGTMSAQAVGGAVGHNPISIVIPCHRVVGADGSLTGYAGGIKTKTALLELEKVKMDGLYIPKKGTAL